MASQAETQAGVEPSEVVGKFKHTHHAVDDMYSRDIDFTFDSSDGNSFIRALNNTANTRRSTMWESDAFGEKHWKVLLCCQDPEGTISTVVQSLRPETIQAKWSIQIHATSPNGKVLYKDRVKNIQTLTGNKSRIRNTATLDVAKVRNDPEFAASQKLTVVVKITERVRASPYNGLAGSAFSLLHLATSLDLCLFQPKDVRFCFVDGVCEAHSKVLLRKCAHFKATFEGGFMEGVVETDGKSNSGPASTVNERRTSKRLNATSSKAQGSRSLKRTRNATIESEELVYDEDHDDSDMDSVSVRKVQDPPAHLNYKIVMLPNFSVRTFRAFLLYLYSSHVSLSKLKSSTPNTSPPDEVAVHEMAESLCPCSARSLYRMADYFDVPKLKAICLAHIKACITPENVLYELCRKFTREHPAVSEMLEAYAVEHWSKVTETDGFEDAMKNALEHAIDCKAFTRILKHSSKK